MLRKSTFLAVLIIALLNPIAKADDYIKREFRAIWLTTVWAIDGSLSLWPRNYLKKFSMNCCTVHYFFIPLYVIVRKRQKLIVCILDLLKLKMVRWLIFKSR